MAFTFKELKQARNNVMDSFGLSSSDASKVVGYFNGLVNARPDIVTEMISGDMSGVGPALAALGVNTSENTPEPSPEKISTAAGDPGEKISPEPVTRSARKTARNASRTKEKKTSATCTALQDKHKSGAAWGVATSPAALQTEPGKDQPQHDQLETVAGEIVQNDLNGLPAGTTDMIMSYIEMWCKRDNITDLKKERQTTWKAICMELGAAIFKKSKLLHDVKREKACGGIYYDYDKLVALCDYWGALCYRFGKAPMIDDFARFAGVADSTIYNTGGNYPNLEKATPARTVLLKKLHTLQESGLAGLIVDGRQNPTGALAALNHWHGWTQTREIIHTAGQGSQTAAALPVFGPDGGLLEDKRPE